MSDLDNAINSINASAAKAENTAGFLDDMSTFDDQSSVTNPNNGQTVASIPKQVKDRTDELFTAAESDINQAVSDAAQSATDAQDAADSIGRYQGLWPDSGGIADKGDTYQTQVSGTPTGKYFTALQNTTVDPVGDNVNWRAVVSFSSISGENLVSNAFFEIAGSVANPPGATSRDYIEDDEIFQGVFASGTLTGVTYVNGKLSGTGQLYTDVYKSEKQNLSTVQYVASTALSDGLPDESGASFVDSGDYWRITFNVNNTFSVKFEQGLVATSHKTKSLFDIYGHPNMGIYNPKAFGCIGDGVTDDYESALRCFQAAAGREVTLTEGVFLLGSTIKLPAVLKVSCVSPKGSADVGFKSNSGSFLFEAADDVFAKYEFSGVGFDAANCLDMRATQRSTPVSGDVSNCTFIGGDGTGVAVHLHNADFFTGSGNNFFNWSGVCAVVSQGWMDADTFNNNKNSTQINWHDNIFSSNQEIGFSLDVVDSCTLEKNDFGATPVAYDIGGFQYRARKQGSTNNYKRGEADPTVISWQSGTTFEGLGWFSHVSLDHNHYEFGGWAVYADGRNADQGVNLTVGNSDNCIFDNTSLGGYYFRRTYDSAILRPRVDFKNNTSAQCIYYELGANLSIDSTRIYSSVSGQTTTNDIVDGGGHFFLDRVNATGGFDYNDDRRPVHLNMRAQNLSANNVTELKSITPAYNSIPQRNTSPFLPFSEDGVLNNGDVIGLIAFEDIAGNRPCGIIVINVLTSIGTVCSTWAVGHDSVVRISNESASPSVYELVWDGTTKTIQLQSNAANGTSFEVNGFAMVSGIS